MDASVRGKVAIVTGANRGIGYCVATALAESGCSVMLTARDKSALDKARSEIVAAGGIAAHQTGDITREDHVCALVKETVAQFGQLDIVINNAGMGYFGLLENTTSAQWDEIMAVNARGPFLLCREAIPHLRKQSVSYIINIGSVVSTKGYPEQVAYSASKHALLGMTKALARELQPDNIRVHAVLPGAVNTELVTEARRDLDPSVLMQPEEVADTVLFLVTRSGNAVIDQIAMRRAASTPWA